MNWGKWIVVSFVLFAGFIAIIVTVSMKQDVSLVSTQYYQDDLEFQKQLDRKNNTAALVNQPEIILSSERLQVSFPENADMKSGIIKIFRPSDDALDQNFEWQASTESTHVFALKPLDKGAYRIKMTWKGKDKEYYLEKFVVI
jgi:hypothetical protein